MEAISGDVNSPADTVSNRLQLEPQASSSAIEATNSKYTEEAIKSELKSGKLQYRKVRYIVKNGVKRSVVSVVWEEFFQIYDVENNNDIANWYVCLACNEPIENIYGGGTTVKFHRHIKYCRGKIEGMKTIVDYFHKPKRIKVSEKHIENFKEATVRFVSEDLRPYSAIEGNGISELIVAAVRLGQVYPNMSKEDIMTVIPGRSIVKRAVENKAHTAKAVIAKKLQDAIAMCGGFGATADLWTDCYRQKSYLAITAHINIPCENRITHERLIVALKEVEDESKTKEVVEREIFDCFMQYGLTHQKVIENMHLVTDRGPQMKAMTQFERFIF